MASAIQSWFTPKVYTKIEHLHGAIPLSLRKSHHASANPAPENTRRCHTKVYTIDAIKVYTRGSVKVYTMATIIAGRAFSRSR
jgi:hypothetical protein